MTPYIITNHPGYYAVRDARQRMPGAKLPLLVSVHLCEADAEAEVAHLTKLHKKSEEREP